MAGMQFSFKLRNAEIDQRAVMTATAKKSQRALFFFGGYCLRVMRNSIKSNDKVSKPGQPPFSHEGTLKRLMEFVVEPEKQNVVIGPMLSGGSKSTGSGTMPQTLEEGGSRTAIRLAKNGGKFTAVTARYKARPFAGPAFQKSLPKAADQYGENVSGPLRA